MNCDVCGKECNDTCVCGTPICDNEKCQNEHMGVEDTDTRKRVQELERMGVAEP